VFFLRNFFAGLINIDVRVTLCNSFFQSSDYFGIGSHVFVVVEINDHTVTDITTVGQPTFEDTEHFGYLRREILPHF
jgi:hypothetical protein